MNVPEDFTDGSCIYLELTITSIFGGDHINFLGYLF